jgi:hypothetical protein
MNEPSMNERNRAMATEDVLAITHIINLYGVAMDSQRWDPFDRIFTPDVDADFGESSHWRDLIRHRTCRIVWRDGNPLVQETIPGVKCGSQPQPRLPRIYPSKRSVSTHMLLRSRA